MSFMELELRRAYYPNGTNGSIFIADLFIAYSIELPWKDNHTQVSCIPEGRYALTKRYTLRFGKHAELVDVPGRSLILIHPANDALKELKGCIAPVSILTDAGKCLGSRSALEILNSFVYKAFAQGEPVFIIIKS